MDTPATREYSAKQQILVCFSCIERVEACIAKGLLSPEYRTDDRAGVFECRLDLLPAPAPAPRKAQPSAIRTKRTTSKGTGKRGGRRVKQPSVEDGPTSTMTVDSIHSQSSSSSSSSSSSDESSEPDEPVTRPTSRAEVERPSERGSSGSVATQTTELDDEEQGSVGGSVRTQGTVLEEDEDDEDDAEVEYEGAWIFSSGLNGGAEGTRDLDRSEADGEAEKRRRIESPSEG